VTEAWPIERVLPGQEDDLDAVSALEAESFRNPWTRDLLVRELTSPAARLYVLRSPGRAVAAFCACWVIADELHINTLAVRHELRRRGLGRALIQRVLDLVAVEGVDRATLEVRRSNVPALRLYESLGFRVTAVRPRYYNTPVEDAVILWRGSAGPS
jgi:ribosomal-protein-alanine acetyltransferase